MAKRQRDQQYIYDDCLDPDIVGGKGSSLAVMKSLGLPVPEFMTISTDAFRDVRDGKLSMKRLMSEHVMPAVGVKFPTLGSGMMVSVRSGAPKSMPGMMDTIINLGARLSKNPREFVALERSWIAAHGGSTDNIDDRVDNVCIRNGEFFLNQIADEFVSMEYEPCADIPTDMAMALEKAIRAVFKSWDSQRAVQYRKMYDIPDDMGTACTIQRMVLGTRLGGSGILFTRGDEGQHSIDWSADAQGDAVVGGTCQVLHSAALRARFKTAYEKLVEYGRVLEQAYRDAMDIEFTVERGELYMLQCRVAKRTPVEAMRIACELFNDGIVPVRYLMNTPVVDDAIKSYAVRSGMRITSGMPVTKLKGIGALTNKPKETGGPYIYISNRASPDNIDQFKNSAGVITEYGGPTCHAAILARQMNLPCIVGTGTSPSDVYEYFGDEVTMMPDGHVYSRATIEEASVPGKWSQELQAICQTWRKNPDYVHDKPDKHD